MDLCPTGKSPYLTGPSEALYQKLQEKSELIASMYLGGKAALSNPENPEYLVHSAHSFRELIEKLPDVVDIRFKERKLSIKTKVHELQVHWDRVVLNIDKYNGDKWEGTIDKCLRKFLIKSLIFFDWHKEHSPKRKAEAASMIDRMDISQRTLPDTIMALRVEEYDAIKDFFVGVAHHKSSVTEKVFISWIETLESFLIDRLIPRTYLDMEEIDSIVDEGESK